MTAQSGQEKPGGRGSKMTPGCGTRPRDNCPEGRERGGQAGGEARECGSAAHSAQPQPCAPAPSTPHSEPPVEGAEAECMAPPGTPGTSALEDTPKVPTSRSPQGELFPAAHLQPLRLAAHPRPRSWCEGLSLPLSLALPQQGPRRGKTPAGGTGKSGERVQWRWWAGGEAWTSCYHRYGASPSGR